MVGIYELYAEKIRVYVDGNLDKSLTIPDSIKGLNPEFEMVQSKIKDERFRGELINAIVEHIMKYNYMYDKPNLDLDVRIKGFMNKIYTCIDYHQIALLAIHFSERLAVEAKRGK